MFAGSPLPRVVWNVRGENPDNEHGIRIGENVVANVLRIDHVRRESHGTELVCEASNMQNTVQLSTSVTMNVYRESDKTPWRDRTTDLIANLISQNASREMYSLDFRIKPWNDFNLIFKHNIIIRVKAIGIRITVGPFGKREWYATRLHLFWRVYRFSAIYKNSSTGIRGTT